MTIDEVDRILTATKAIQERLVGEGKQGARIMDALDLLEELDCDLNQMRVDAVLQETR